MTIDLYNQELQQACADMKAGHSDKALQTFNKLIEQGCVKAHLYLGWMSEQNNAESHDLDYAESHYAKLANTDDIDGYYYLGSLQLKRGKIDNALHSLSIAAEKGNPSAAYWASTIYKDSQTLANNQEKEIQYLNLAKNLGHIYAARDLAFIKYKRSVNLIEKINYKLVYIWMKIRGIILIVKNHNDLRVR